MAKNNVGPQPNPLRMSGPSLSNAPATGETSGLHPPSTGQGARVRSQSAGAPPTADVPAFTNARHQGVPTSRRATGMSATSDPLPSANGAASRSREDAQRLERSDPTTGTTRTRTKKDPDSKPRKGGSSQVSLRQLIAHQKNLQASREPLKARASTVNHRSQSQEKEEKAEKATRSTRRSESVDSHGRRHVRNFFMSAREVDALKQPSSQADIGVVASRKLASHEPKDATDVLQRAQLLLRLLVALDNGDMKAIIHCLEAIPAKVEDYGSYFPPAPLHFHHDILLQVAQTFHDGTPTASSERLLDFAIDNMLRWNARDYAALDDGKLATSQLQRLRPPAVRDLCAALKDTHELALATSEHPWDDLFRLAAQTDHLTVALAIQPHANLRMVQLKCTVLSTTQKDPTIANHLLTHIQEARDLQTNASAQLRHQLLQPTLDPSAVAAFALMAYARQMTDLPVDHVSAGATRDEVGTMHRAIGEVYTSFLQASQDEVSAEVVALGWLMAQMQQTLSLSQ